MNYICHQIKITDVGETKLCGMYFTILFLLMVVTLNALLSRGYFVYFSQILFFMFKV